MNFRGLAASALALAGLACSGVRAADPARLRVYVGTYTEPATGSKGIYHLELDLATGALAAVGDPVPATNPSFLALHPGGLWLYAVNELGETRDDPQGSVSAFAVDRTTGGLTPLNRQPSTGAAPCHLAIDGTGRHLLVANYTGGSVAVLPIRADGTLGPATTAVRHEGRSVDPERQQGPHAHYVGLDAAERFALVADLGLDQVIAYRFDAAKGLLASSAQPVAGTAPGAGPRHLDFHPDGRHVYLINELDSTLTTFDYEPASGRLVERQTVSTLPDGFRGKSFTAEVAVHPGGRFVYGSNRGHDSIAVFAIDAASGRLTPIGHEPTLGKWPRHFAIDPTGSYLLAANQNSDTLVVFRIDPASGRLEAVGEPFPVPRPVCVLMAAPPSRR